MAIKKKGFTVIEVLIAIAVSGILLGIGSINLSNYLGKLHLNQATTEFVSDLKAMSDDALRFSERVELNETLLPNGNVVWYSNQGELGNLKLAHGAYVADIQKSIPAQSIWFTGRGLPFQQVRFTVRLKQREQQILLLPTGLVVLL